MYSRTNIIKKTFVVIILGLSIYLFSETILTRPKIVRKIVEVEIQKSNDTIVVEYVDWGGSYGDRGGIHLNTYWKKNFFQKIHINTPKKLPCSLETAKCITPLQKPLQVEDTIYWYGEVVSRI